MVEWLASRKLRKVMTLGTLQDLRRGRPAEILGTLSGESGEVAEPGETPYKESASRGAPACKTYGQSGGWLLLQRNLATSGSDGLWKIK